MTLMQDLKHILATTQSTDPSFGQVETAAIENCVEECRMRAEEGQVDAFLLAAMRLLALPNNGHTRLIPNDAISVHPLRFLWIGRTVQLVRPANGDIGPMGELLDVNGVPIAQIAEAAQCYLAGTRQRKRVIGPILFAWPYALARLGAASPNTGTRYRIMRKDGQVTTLTMAHDDLVPASTLYPRNEHGRADPGWQPETFFRCEEFHDKGLAITLPSFFDPDETKLPEEMRDAAVRVGASRHAKLLIDVRGNTGGDFIKAMPLIDSISQTEAKQVVLLVDKFTFSAAIVFVSILKHCLGDRVTIIGEEMGDSLTFYAEGGLRALPVSGAAVRFSTAFHDWANGTSDATTPPEIGRELVAAREIAIDKEWVSGRLDDEGLMADYQGILKDIAS